MTQRAIPYHFFRGGTSRGPYFRRADLPDDQASLTDTLVQVIGSGNPRNIDGIGGGDPVTTKVAMLSPSAEPDIDVDYFFAQVSPTEPLVDYGPTCGNILVGVGPAAIEMGLVQARVGTTMIRIRATNTGAKVEALVQTPGGQVTYDGETAIDGVPGTAAPIALNFLDVVGSKSGQMFPTGRPIDIIDGIEVSCVDVAMPMMIARLADFGLHGHETKADLDADGDLFARMETIRRQAGQRMGFGDVSGQVIPKIGLIGPSETGHLLARYFMPWKTHPALAVTGSQCLAACALAPGTVADGIAKPVESGPATMTIDYATGQMDVAVDFARSGRTLDFRSAGLVRTARLIARGDVLVRT
ncbi:MAG: 4-oxalomesaconate tautomerase [Pseudomonadota bacterium]